MPCMRAAAIVRPGNVSNYVARFQAAANVEWTSLLEMADVVVIFGGDGTIHRNISTLVELEVPILVVPCGSGNDFARALSLRSLRDSLNAWREYVAGGNNVRSIDLGVIRWCETRPAQSQATEPRPSVPRERYFCCVAGVGLDSEIARRANSLPRWIRSHGGYGLCAPPEFVRFVPFPMKISFDGAESSARPTTLVAVANAPAYGGGMKIAPYAKLDDGKLDVCVVRAMDTFKLFCLFPTVYFGRHLDLDEVEYSQIATVRIETQHPLDVYADGEYVCQTPVEFSVARNALQVIVPDSAICCG
jgi:diacylglycerol kinase (ATP)